jgi:hypothetical protein
MIPVVNLTSRHTSVRYGGRILVSLSPADWRLAWITRQLLPIGQSQGWRGAQLAHFCHIDHSGRERLAVGP